MRSSLRTSAPMLFSMLVGLSLITGGATRNNRAKAEQFQPIKEAEMPPDFPGYTPVGQIELKQYPAYRKASASGAAQFWMLFQHIKRNKVQMTAPVELEYGDFRAAPLAERSMSFLYERPDQGSTGRQGSVKVVDVPAMTVISIGCRGSRTPAAVAEAREKLLDYITERKNHFAILGPMRVMGYNSPFVPRDKNFFEVQFPIRVAGTD